MQTVMFNRYHDVRPNTYFTNITSQSTMPWNRPWCSYQLEIFREYAQTCFRKSQKISGSYLKPFGRYLRKTRGVDKNNPLPLIGLKVECLLTLAIWSYGHEAEEYIFLNLPFPSNPKENSSIRCILSTPEQNLLLRIIGCTIRAIGCTPTHFTTL